VEAESKKTIAARQTRTPSALEGPLGKHENFEKNKPVFMNIRVVWLGNTIGKERFFGRPATEFRVGRKAKRNVTPEV
jgi:hypothetical protein